MRPRPNDERGAALALAVVFMVVIGIISVGLITFLSSGFRQRDVLDTARDRQYAAESAVQYAIEQVRSFPNPGPAQTGCGSDAANPAFFNRDGMHVDCLSVPGVTRAGYLQRNVVFAACVSSDVSSNKCQNGKIIIRAQVNFEATGSGAGLSVNRTWIQSWSVNK